jgi:hypothetical protein
MGVALLSHSSVSEAVMSDHLVGVGLEVAHHVTAQVDGAMLTGFDTAERVG